MFLLTVLGVLAIGSALPMSEDDISRAAMYNPNLFEGDITGIPKDADRNAIVNTAKLWTGGVVPYVIDSSLSAQREIILSAMASYHDKTCIRFVPKTSAHTNYMLLRPVDGCTSPVGMQGGMQEVSLVNGCWRRQIVEHELGHGIGFWHEQSRSDRDDYLTIYWNNIEEKNKFNFDKLEPWVNNFLGETFDYDSVMLYDNYAFSKQPGVAKTMVAKTGVPLLPVWEKRGLSDSDIRRINRLYECFGEKRPEPVEPPDWECDFESDTCGMTNLDPVKQWSWAQMTVGGQTSNVMVIQGAVNSGAGFITPWLKSGKPRKNCCVELSAFINGKDAFGIRVYLFDGTNAGVKLIEYTTKSNNWQKVQMKTDVPSENVAIAFYGYGFNTDSTIAIDNIRISPNPCK